MLKERQKKAKEQEQSAYAQAMHHYSQASSLRAFIPAPQQSRLGKYNSQRALQSVDKESSSREPASDSQLTLYRPPQMVNINTPIMTNMPARNKFSEKLKNINSKGGGNPSLLKNLMFKHSMLDQSRAQANES